MIKESLHRPSVESATIRESVRILEDTVGWGRLSNKQKNIIRDTLNEPPMPVVDDDPSAPTDWYCHAAVWALEKEIAHTGSTPPHLDTIEDTFFEGEYIQPSSIDELRAVIERVGFPAVVHIAGHPPPLTLLQVHTFVIIGEREDGELVGWEKQSEQEPFRKITLTENFRLYTEKGRETPYYWGVRQLESSV